MPEDGMDYFAVLGLERKAALDAEAVKEAFHAVSRSAHPDAAGAEGGGDFDRVSEAYRQLKDPVLRLKHLLALEFPEAAAGGAGRAMISGDLLELFGRVGEAIQNADAVLKKKAESRTALGRAVVAPEEMTRHEALQDLGAEVHAAMERAEARLVEMDALRTSDRAAAAALGGELARRMSFLSKWRDQIREKTAAFL